MTESARTSHPAARGRLVKHVTCPNCWHRFGPERLLFVARHESLLGDPVAGPQAYRRFLPSRFTPTGDAIDPHGMACQEVACPQCHLPVARALVEMAPLYCSIAGAPASGKSYFLATMTWQLRQQAPLFGLRLSDADPMANHELQRYEEALFLAAEPDRPVEIRKTETGGTQLYQTVNLDGQLQTLPRPFIFTLQPREEAGGNGRPDPDRHRALVIYDNAGEHFLPGQDTTETPVTLHLGRAAAILFMFDPTQDPRFRQRCHSDDPQLRLGLRAGDNVPLMRQEAILAEIAARIRRHTGLGHTQRHARPLVVILAKADIWADLIDLHLDREPFHPEAPASLDVDRIEQVSQTCRGLMHELCPEIAAAAEGFAERTLYIPISSLGCSPELVEEGGRRFYGIRPSRIHPRWVTVPLLWTLAQHGGGLIPTDRPHRPRPSPAPGRRPRGGG